MRPIRLIKLLIIAKISSLKRKCPPLGHPTMTTKLLLISSRTRTRSRTMKGKLSLPRSQRLPNHNQKLPMLDPNWFKKTIKKINRLRMLQRRKKKHKNKRKKNRKRPSKIRKIKL